MNAGQRWKRVRSVLSPVFSPSSMRDVAPTVEEKVQLLVDKLREKSEDGKGFDIYISFQMLTLEIIAQMSENRKTSKVVNSPRLHYGSVL